MILQACSSPLFALNNEFTQILIFGIFRLYLPILIRPYYKYVLKFITSTFKERGTIQTIYEIIIFKRKPTEP